MKRAICLVAILLIAGGCKAPGECQLGCRSSQVLPVSQTPELITIEPNEPMGIVTIREMKEKKPSAKAIEKWLYEQAAEEARAELLWKRKMLAKAAAPQVGTRDELYINPRLGMTKDQAISQFGYPNDINRSVGSWGIHEQWVYGINFYLYFENGILTSWQKSTSN